MSYIQMHRGSAKIERWSPNIVTSIFSVRALTNPAQILDTRCRGHARSKFASCFRALFAAPDPGVSGGPLIQVAALQVLYHSI